MNSLSYYMCEIAKPKPTRLPIVNNEHFNYCFNPFALPCRQAAWYKIWVEEQEKYLRSRLATEKRFLLYMLQWGFPTGPYWEKPIDIRTC
ncbi:MAG: hypothetical protein QW476_01530 [Candidatus Bathyarchaeia archaeon]|nr:hypothetical protein [Candidatus Bathyarchaeota archaeon]